MRLFELTAPSDWIMRVAQRRTVAWIERAAIAFEPECVVAVHGASH